MAKRIRIVALYPEALYGPAFDALERLRGSGRLTMFLSTSGRVYFPTDGEEWWAEEHLPESEERIGRDDIGSLGFDLALFSESVFVCEKLPVGLYLHPLRGMDGNYSGRFVVSTDGSPSRKAS